MRRQKNKSPAARKERIEFQAEPELKRDLLDVAALQDRQMSDMARVFIREGINRIKAASASSNDNGHYTAAQPAGAA